MSSRLSRAAILRVAVVAVVAVAALVLAVRAASSNQQPAGSSTQPTSWKLPRLGATGSLSLSGLRGHPVVVDFFASWCTACRGELPGMATLSRQLQGRVTFAGVDSQETGDGLAMARQYGVDWWPLARDVGGTDASGLHDALGGHGMPITAFYDGSGRLLRVVLGAITDDDLRARIEALYGIAV